MMRRGLLLVVVPAVLALAACGTGGPTPSGSAPTVTVSPRPATAKPTPTPTPTRVIPQVVDPANYLIDGAPGAEGTVWQAIYGFYTDASKAVRCDFFVNSESPGYTSCEITKGHETEVTYDVPSEVTAPCDGLNGFEVGVGVFQQTGSNVAFNGCRSIETDKPAAVATTKVIPNGGSLTVKNFTCSALDGVATCTLGTNGPHFVFGLSVATIVN